jgi:hypothetical protein
MRGCRQRQPKSACRRRSNPGSRERSGTFELFRELSGVEALRASAKLASNLLGVWELAWSGKRGSNPRHPPWQGGALPLSYSRKEGEG